MLPGAIAGVPSWQPWGVLHPSNVLGPQPHLWAKWKSNIHGLGLQLGQNGASQHPVGGVHGPGTLPLAGNPKKVEDRPVDSGAPGQVLSEGVAILSE